jgi:hypothetical protein
MLRRPIWKWVFATLLTFVIALVALLLWLRPDTTPRKEIYRGVFLTIEDLHKGSGGSGKAMIIEVHWDTPGVQINNRPYFFPVRTGDPHNPHYRLAFADFALAQEDAEILINTTLYTPHRFDKSLPGMPVRSVETLVTNGKISHVHPHSYLLFWDHLKEAQILTRKPPDSISLGKAVTGIGLNGVQVRHGEAFYGAIANLDHQSARSFIGIDPVRRVLYLLAFENVSARAMIDWAVKAGVVHGGQVDSGSSTNLLIGSGADDITPHTGIRNWRPLGPYLTIQANPL